MVVIRGASTRDSVRGYCCCKRERECVCVAEVRNEEEKIDLEEEEGHRGV